jgi:hypothetical protein
VVATIELPREQEEIRQTFRPEYNARNDGAEATSTATF